MGVPLRQPFTMLHRAAQPGRAVPALGFVADAAVLGTRVVSAPRSVARGRNDPADRRGGRLVSHCGRAGLGGVLYVVVMALLAQRVSRSRIRSHELTSDWWIVMGAPAIFALAGATFDRGGLASPIGVF
jgi:hypothetical protein